MISGKRRSHEDDDDHSHSSVSRLSRAPPRRPMAIGFGYEDEEDELKEDSRNRKAIKKIFQQAGPGMQHLFDNNKRWVQRMTRIDKDYFKRMVAAQHPKYLIISCADSRVPVVELLGFQPGECFIHRNVANLVVTGDMNCLSVVQYAVDHLKVKDIIIVGHYLCGGCKAASTGVDHGLLEHWLRHIRDVIFENIEEIRKFDNDDDQLRRIVELNVREGMLNLYRNPVIQAKQAETGKYPRIHGMVYDIADGYMRELKVDFMKALEKNDVYAVVCKGKYGRRAAVTDGK